MFDSLNFFKPINKVLVLGESIKEQLVLLNKTIGECNHRLMKLESDVSFFKSQSQKQLDSLKSQERFLDIFLQRYMYETLRIGNRDNLFSFPYLGETITFSLPFCSFDHIQFEILSKAAFFEKAELELVRKNYFNVNKLNTVLDIGANIGNHSLYFAKFCNSKVFSFEPQKNLCEIAHKNYEMNGVLERVEVIQKALGSTESKGCFGSFTSQNTGASTVSPSVLQKEFSIAPLDSFDFRHIDFIKIDVEGFEKNVLEGGKKTLASSSCPLWIEIFPDNYVEVERYLEKVGYDLAEKLPNHNYIFISHRSI